MKRQLIILLCIAALHLASWGQTVVGEVHDARSGEPLEFVNVGVVGSAVGTTSDAKGRFSLDLPTADTVVLRFSFTGYQSQERRAAAGMVLAVSLSPTPHQLEQVEIRDERDRYTTFTPISADKLENAVGPSAGVESLIKMLPDVSSNNELSSQYSVRGGSFDENLVYINGVEIFRPLLVRNAQQEGMSIINPDLVDYILFSPGGFDAKYDDKMSSVLDITYGTPREFEGKASVSLLGAAAAVRGTAGERLAYAVGVRHHNNSYILGSMDTKGSYTTSYTDLQALLQYAVNEKLSLGTLVLLTNNIYGLVPESQTTTFGGFFKPLVFRTYFDGQEKDRYSTVHAAITSDWRPNEDWRVKSYLSLQHIDEGEQYDVQSQYFLYELAMGETAGDTVMFDRGVGTFLEHARNSLVTDIFSYDIRANCYAKLGDWDFGLKLQAEQVDDHLREWRWVDSAGFALPHSDLPLGDTANMPTAPILQQYANNTCSMATLRASAFAQRSLNFTTRKQSDIQILMGLRSSIYTTIFDDNGLSRRTPVRYFFAPRLSASYKPNIPQDMLFRLAVGVYNQPLFYREYRHPDGHIVPNLPQQNSYQATASFDWRLPIREHPFTLTVDQYYKYITNLIPYTVDNLRIMYHPDKQAVAYATGVSIRFGGQLVKDLESWASLSIMRTQEDIVGDDMGWLDRPTDQRFSFKLFLQDNIPQIPWWRMSLQLIYGTGVPVTIPMMERMEQSYRLPSYYRVDWGNTVQLCRFNAIKRLPMMRHIEDIQVGVEVFNLFNFRNVASFLWIADYENHYYPVPNYLTARQLNFKLTVLF